MRPPLHAERGTGSVRAVPPAAEDADRAVDAQHGARGTAEARAQHEEARTTDDPRAGRGTHPTLPSPDERDTSPTPGGEPERRGASAYLREVAETGEDERRVDNPIDPAIDASEDERSLACGDDLASDRCASLCPVCLDSSEGST